MPGAWPDGWSPARRMPIGKGALIDVTVSQVVLGEEELNVASQGTSGYGLDAQTRLLAEHAVVRPGQAVAIGPCAQGALGVWAARRMGGSGVVQFDTNAGTLQIAQRTAQLNDLSALQVKAGTPGPAHGLYDVVLMRLPKGRDLARLYLANAYLALRRQGHLYLSGENRGGIRPVLKDASTLFESVDLLGYKGGARIARCDKQSDRPAAELPSAFSAPGMIHGTYAEFDATVGSHVYRVCSRPGVFSWQHLDEGTQLLLGAQGFGASDRVIDVGCGYGIVGLHAARCSSQTMLIDIDALACECARETLRRNGVLGLEPVHADGLACVPSGEASLVVSNPAFHLGHQVDTSMAASLVPQAYRALRARGHLVVVANRFLRYEHLMGDVFGNWDVLAENPRYRVLAAAKTGRRQSDVRRRP